MKKLLQMRKMLLVAAGLLVGASAWAEDTSDTVVDGSSVTETYDFNGWGLANLEAKATAVIAKASEEANHSIEETAVYKVTDPTSTTNSSAKLLLNNRFAMSNPGTDRTKQQVLFYNSDKSGNRAYFGGTAVGGYISILNLPKDATITLTSEGTFKIKSNNLSLSGSAVNVDTDLSSDATYTVTEAGNVDLYHDTWTGIKKLVIKYTSEKEIVTNPTLEITGANGNDRIITVTDGASAINSPATTYYTINGEDPTSSSTKVENGKITVSSSCTIKAITISSTGGESAIVELDVEAGTTIKLANPIVTLSEMTKAEDVYNPTYTFKADATGIYGSPEISLTATFNGSNVESPYTVTEAGTLTITVSATGYASTSTNLVYEVAPIYTLTNSADFAGINSSNISETLGETWTIGDASTRWASWSKTGGINADGTANEGEAYYIATTTSVFPCIVSDFVSLNTNGTQLLIGYGFGINGKTTQVSIPNAAAKSIAQYIESDYGSNAYDRFVFDAEGLPITIYAGGVIKGVKYYTIKVSDVSATVGTTGYATFASNFALDLDKLPAGVTAYYASAVNEKSVTLTAAKGQVKAGTGLILTGNAGAYSIPVATGGEAIEDNLLVGCPNGGTLDSDANSYVLVNNNNKPEFQSLAKNGATIPVGHAYLNVPATEEEAEARLSIVFEGETTGVAEVKKAEAENGAIYNLAGQRVAQPANGLYIVNGKKVIIK